MTYFKPSEIPVNNGLPNAIERSLAKRFGEVADVSDFGAVGDGVVDDTTAFQNAIATGLKVYAPGDKTYKITASLDGWSNGQYLFGDGAKSTTILPYGNINVFSFSDTCQHVGIRDLAVNGINLTGGYVLHVNGADRVLFENIRIDQPWNVAYVYQCNAYTARNIYVQEPRGPYAWHLYGEIIPGDTPTVNRSDVVRLQDVNVGGPSDAKTWTGIYWDGFVNTLQCFGVTFVQPLRGVHVLNSTGNPACRPYFGIFHDLEVDFPAMEGVKIEDGAGFWFTTLYIQGSAAEAGVYIGDTTDSVKIVNGYIRGNYKEGLNSGAQDVAITNTQFVFNSYSNPTSNYYNYSAVKLRTASSRVQIASSQFGRQEGIGSTVGYGLYVETGADSVRVAGCDFSGCLLGDVYDAYKYVPAWQSSENYNVDDLVTNDYGKVFKCVQAGVSSSDSNAGPKVENGITTGIVDFEVIWDFFFVPSAGNITVVGSSAVEQAINTQIPGWEIGIKSGSGAILQPTFDESGHIIDVAVFDGGKDYSVAPSIIAQDPLSQGDGNFAATAQITDGVITGITVDDTGASYSTYTKVFARSGVQSPTLKARFIGQPDSSARIEADGAGFVRLGNSQGAGALVTAVPDSVNYVVLRGSADGQRVAVYSGGSSDDIGINYVAKGTGAQVFSANDGVSNSAISLEVIGDPTAENYIRINPAASGVGPSIIAVGSDASVDLVLAPQGAAGVLDVNGPLSGSAGSLAGYLEIKIGGASYKLPYYNMS